MSNGKEELKQALVGLSKAVEENPCSMGSATFLVLALFIKEIVRFTRSKQYLSSEEAARMIGISPRTLRRRVQEGLLPPPKHYGHWEVSYKREDIEEYINKQNKD